MNNELDKYIELTRKIYSGMTTEKKEQWISSFIKDSLTSSEAYFFREELDDESQHFLRQKIELLKNIDGALSSFYNDNYKTVDIDSYKFTVSYAIQCNKEICQQTTDFIFNQDLTKEERETQLTGVLANYYFSLFQLEEIRDIIHNISSPDNNPFTKLFGQ